MTVYQYAGNDPFNNNDPGGDKLAQPQAYQYMAYYSQLANSGQNLDVSLDPNNLPEALGGGDESIKDEEALFSAADNGDKDAIAAINAARQTAGQTSYSAAAMAYNDAVVAQRMIDNNAGNGSKVDIYYQPNGDVEVDEAPGAKHSWINVQTDSRCYSAPIEDVFDFAGDIASQKGGFPTFASLWENYPCTNAQGVHSFILPQSQYYNQCAIRLGYDLIQSGANFRNYKGLKDPKTGYPLGATELANWVKQQLGNPMIFSYDDFTEYYSSHPVQGIIYELPNGGPAHIDLIYNGNHTMTAMVGEDFYLTKTIWYWPLK